MTTPKHAGGRKPLLTPEVQAEFFNARAMGLSLERSAKLAGTTYTTIRNWRIQGEAALSTPANKRTPMDVKCLEFLKELEQIDNEWLRRCEIVLNLSMAPGQSRKTWDEATPEERREATATAKWKLSHQASTDYSTQARTELTGQNGGPVLSASMTGEQFADAMELLNPGIFDLGDDDE